jgi:hypothetical protein
MRTVFAKLASVLIACAFLSGCGYQLGSIKVGDKRKLHVPVFKNNTGKYGIEGLVTSAVINRLMADGAYQIVGENDADYILDGQITEYRRDANVFNDQDITNEFRITLIARLEMKDAKSGNIIWRTSKAYGESNYVRGANQQESERAAWPTAMDNLARDVSAKVSDGGW